MTLQALREKVGEFTFSRIIRDWATQNRYGNVTTPQFIAHAEQISGQDLTALLRRLALPGGQADELVSGIGGLSPESPGSAHGRTQTATISTDLNVCTRAHSETGKPS